ADEGAVSVTGQVEFGDDEGMEEADEVRARAHHEPAIVKRAVESARSAQLLPAFEHEDGASGAREIGGGGQAVVPAADDDRVPFSMRTSIEPPSDVNVRNSGGEGGG